MITNPPLFAATNCCTSVLCHPTKSKFFSELTSDEGIKTHTVNLQSVGFSEIMKDAGVKVQTQSILYHMTVELMC